jgi:glycosyltransferase involved in cell wall biosynthesis
MVIVYVLTSLGMGGAERQVLALAERMADRGHTVKIMVLRPRIAEQWPTALPVIHLDMSRTPVSVLKGLGRAQRFFRSYRPDIVHSHSFHANLVARLLKPRVRAPIVLSTVHNVNEGGLHRMIIYRLTDFLASRTTAVSQAAAERFVHLKAIPIHKCTVVTNGIDIEEFRPVDERRAEMRAAFEVTSEFVWLAAGRLVPAKDFPNLLRAFEIAKSVFPNAQLWIAGQAMGAEINKLDNLKIGRNQSSMNNVRWLGLRRDMPALLDAADGFVLASAWEGMPLVVGEAMAMEKPVVATDVGGVRELVGDVGMIVPPRNSEGLAGAMVQMMQTSIRERVRLGKAARARIATGFSMSARTGQWEALYRDEFTRGR